VESGLFAEESIEGASISTWLPKKTKKNVEKCKFCALANAEDVPNTFYFWMKLFRRIFLAFKILMINIEKNWSA
jgi:hypothetical protein